ncbi:ceramide synthase 1 [Limosa lapponica baueri]|uniref:Ceramide synthase 1 n=1 Tax=Limosa lapponica baueri TaxID=1758121 RepID=A0A2I0T3U6_LIMLA|nr:ceramide synthase 1 [Limosa lapponica baueri]
MPRAGTSRDAGEGCLGAGGCAGSHTSPRGSPLNPPYSLCPGRFWFRLYWFPLKVLYATCYSSLQSVPNIPFYFFFNALLLILTLMNIYWFLYIVLFVAKVLMGQMQEVNDVREYDVEDSKKTTAAKKKEAGLQLPNALKEGVEEFNVPGNIIRVLADQGGTSGSFSLWPL